MNQATLAVAKDLCVTAIPSLLESRAPELIATIAVLLGIATVAVALRLYARKISAAKIGWDDYLIIVALVRHLCSIVREDHLYSPVTGPHLWPRYQLFLL